MNSYLTGPETQRLLHRALTIDDAEAFFALNSNPEVMRYTGEPLLESVKQARKAIDAYPDFKTVGFGRWGCILKSTGQLIGFCGLKHLPELDAVDIGFRFLPEYWGRGLATEAARASIRFGFDTLELNEIIALVLPDNAASIRVIEKLGMQPAGCEDCNGLNALKYIIRRGEQAPTTQPGLLGQ